MALSRVEKGTIATSVPRESGKTHLGVEFWERKPMEIAY